MGVWSFIIVHSRKTKPFQSEPLDKLAETMQVTTLLKRGKLQRYYHTHSLQAGCMSYSDIVLFDSKYYDKLSSEECVAVGAHEFNHLINRHYQKKLQRQILPALVIGISLGLLAFFIYDFFNSFLIFNEIGPIIFSVTIGVVSYIFVFGASFYFNAGWLRQQEIKSDLSAVKFVNGEALISALTKLDKLYPKNSNRFLSRFSPKIYPTFEERMTNIRRAMKSIVN